MKKEYIEPKTELFAVTLSGMLAASDPDVKVDKEEEAIEAGNVESRRRHTVWDDEEEEDY